jgi:hypothetical protein
VVVLQNSSTAHNSKGQKTKWYCSSACYSTQGVTLSQGVRLHGIVPRNSPRLPTRATHMFSIRQHLLCLLLDHAHHSSCLFSYIHTAALCDKHGSVNRTNMAVSAGKAKLPFSSTTTVGCQLTIKQ